MLDEHFWDHQRKAESKINELNYLKNLVSSVLNLESKIKDTIELLREFQDSDLELLNEAFIEQEKIENNLKEIEIKLLLSDKYDKDDCILEIHPGAGGTESQDWALMLKRMYLKWCDKNNYKYEVIDEQIG